ncbi:MAG: TetR/AcrR family transcriptional regulator [Myxococcota bacterium]
MSRDARREETRHRLYQCALTVFRRDGVMECRIDDIARAAGVSRGIFYFHFPTREHVLIARMRETEDQICSAIDALPPNASTDRVLEVLVAEVAAIWEPDPALLVEVCSAGLRLAATAMDDQESTRMRATLAARFRAGVERGEISTRLPPEMLSDLYLGHLLVALLAWRGRRELSLALFLAGTTDLFWAGARAKQEVLDADKETLHPERETLHPERETR